MPLLIFYILLAITVSFICSILEATLLTVTPSAIERAKENGHPWGKRMEMLKYDIDRPLSAILTLNTIAHTMGAAGAGAQYAKLTGNTGEAIFAGVLTIAILVFTEIIPKTIGARFANQLGPVSSTVLIFLITALKPLVLASKSLTGIIAPKKSEPDISEQRDEILAMARMGAASGSLRKRESRFVHNMIQLDGMKVSNIMTPRTVIFSLPHDTLLSEFPRLIADLPFTRIPIFDKAKDDFTGFVIRGDVFAAHLKDPHSSKTLADISKPIEVTSDYTSLDSLFQRFAVDRHHIMLVNDEFGTTVGLVTFEDIIETIFGIEIVDENEQVADLQQHARKLWHERARKMGIEVE